MAKTLLAILSCLGLLLAVPAPAAAQSCPSYVTDNPNRSTLYLVYSPVDDPAFPSYLGYPTSPLGAFDLNALDPAIGTETQLRGRVHELMEAGYCEFDVDVKTATALPASPPEARWQIVGIGTDSSGGPVGLAQDVDTGDADPQDYARIWGQELVTFAGSELVGAGSTLERWARAIANIAAHESGHNYGLSHAMGVAEPGEDATPNHFMTNPALGASSSSITDQFNHHGDTSYEVLGHNVGLSTETLHNWDYTNPNADTADSLVITVLSSASTLNLDWAYTGSMSPWATPAVAATGGTQSFQGTTYNVHQVRFQAPQSWSGGAPGQVPGGAVFHVGTSFSNPDPIIVYDTTLFAAGSALSLKPRMIGYDAGISAGDGMFSVEFFGPSDGSEFTLEDVEVLFLPRMVDLQSMLDGVAPTGLDGERVTPFRTLSPLRNQTQDGPLQVGKEPVRLDLARLTDARHVDRTFAAEDCEEVAFSAFGFPTGAEPCPQGTSLSLFPATYVYVIATFTSDTLHWDPELKEMVEGPVTGRAFFQVAGTVPDFNENGIDDLLDIREGRSRDSNGDGVPDDAREPGRTDEDADGRDDEDEGTDGGKDDDGKGAPGLGLLLVLAALGAGLVLRRRT